MKMRFHCAIFAGTALLSLVLASTARASLLLGNYSVDVSNPAIISYDSNTKVLSTPTAIPATLVLTNVGGANGSYPALLTITATATGAPLSTLGTITQDVTALTIQLTDPTATTNLLTIAQASPTVAGQIYGAVGDNQWYLDGDLALSDSFTHTSDVFTLPPGNVVNTYSITISNMSDVNLVNSELPSFSAITRTGSFNYVPEPASLGVILMAIGAVLGRSRAA